MSIDPAIGPTALAAIGAGFAAIWKFVVKRADECERKHEATTAELMSVKEEVGELKGRIHIAENIVPKLDEIHRAVTERHREQEEQETSAFL